MANLLKNPIQDQPPAMDPSLLASIGGPTTLPAMNQPLPRITSPRQQREEGLMQKISEYENPKPASGFWGKTGHILSTIGNVAGDIFAPATMSLIPGTQLHGERENNANQRELAGLEAEDLADKKQQSESELQGAQAENLEHPNQQLTPTTTGFETFNPKTGSMTATPGGEGKTPYVKPGPLQKVTLMGPDGKPMLGFTRDGETWDSEGNVIQNPTPFEKPTAPQHITVMGPDGKPHVMGADAQGNFTRDLGEAPPNYAMVAPELKTYQTKDATGQNVTKTLGGRTLAPLADTTTMRNMGEMAATVQPMMENVIGEVSGLADSVGPAAGRWNELMVNKGGKDYPEFAGLDTDLDLLASAIVRTHFGARGGQEYRQELRKMFGEAQSPQDLINRIQHAEGWIEGYARAGGAKVPEHQGNARSEGQQIVQMNKKTGAFRFSTDGGKTWQAGKPPSQ